jgi:hypothetical protein
VDRHSPREVDDERDARLQRADQQRLVAVVVARDLGSELADARGNLVGVEVDLADPGIERQLARRSPYRAAMRSKSRS